MSKPVSIPNTFAGQTGPIPLAQLDQDFSTLAAAINDLITYSNYFIDSGVVNALAVTVSAPLTFGLSAGQRLQVVIGNTNTNTAVTLSVNAGAAVALKMNDGTVPQVGQLLAGEILDLMYNGINWIVFNLVPSTIGGILTVGGINVNGSVVPANGIYLPAANTLGFSSNTTQRGTVNATGNWVLNAPSSGVSLSVSTSVGGAGIQVGDGTVTTQWQTSASVTTFGSTSNHGLRLLVNNTPALTITAAGNVSVNAPSSGTPLSLTGAAATNTQFLNCLGTTTGYGYIQIINTGGAFTLGVENSVGGALGVGSTAYATVFGASNNTPLQLLSNNTVRVNIAAAGNVTVNAPTSGATLAINVIASTDSITWTDGTVSGKIGTIAATSIFFGAGSNHALSIRTNNVDRINITASGNATFNAPASGVTLQVNNGAANAGGVATFDSTNGTGTFLSITQSGTANTLLGNGSTICASAALGDTVLRATNSFWLTTGGATARVGITAAGQCSIYEPSFSVAALANAATISTGSFTGTGTGGGGSTTINWSRVGNVVTFDFTSGSGTSTLTTYTLTGLPANLQPARAVKAMSLGQDNSVPGFVVWNFAIGSGTITLGWGTGNLTSGWTGSGAKGITAGSISYNLT